MTTQEQNLPWRSPPNDLALNDGEVHCWKASLNLDLLPLEGMRQSLSDDELLRAGRYHIPRDESRFIAARGILRSILSRYVNTEAHELSFNYTHHGKPELIQKHNDITIRFNVSHSQDVALYAFTLDRKIGVDVELIRPDFAEMEIAERFFSTKEVTEICALPKNSQLNGFFACWTRKEAFVKAMGEGLSLPLDQFEVSVKPGNPARLLDTRWDHSEQSRWSMRELAVYAGYAAAIAVEGHDWKLDCWHWDEPASQAA